jgi:DNA-binding beta-propeller fold protein YncE
MSRWWWAVAGATLIAGCGFKNNSSGGTDGGSGDDTPCMEGPLTMKAATLSGCPNEGSIDGPRGTAYFANPVNMKLGASGIAYVADFDSSLVRRVDTTGTVTTIVKQQGFSLPFGLLVHTNGFLLVETDNDDLGMHTGSTGTIWQVNPASGAATVLIRDIGRPRGLAIAPDGTVYTSDYVHHTIGHFDPANAATGLMPVAGTMDVEGHVNSNGTTPSTFGQPWDLVMDQNGDLLVAEFDNNVIRKVIPGAPGKGIVSDFAGTGVAGHVDGPLATAEFNNPKGIAMDSAGNIYVSEAGNHDIRKISNGMVTTIAGDGNAGYSDNDDPLQAEFYGVEGLDVSPDGTRIVVADGNNGDTMAFNHVRVITP